MDVDVTRNYWMCQNTNPLSIGQYAESISCTVVIPCMFHGRNAVSGFNSLCHKWMLSFWPHLIVFRFTLETFGYVRNCSIEHYYCWLVRVFRLFVPAQLGYGQEANKSEKLCIYCTPCNCTDKHRLCVRSTRTRTQRTCTHSILRCSCVRVYAEQNLVDHVMP